VRMSPDIRAAFRKLVRKGLAIKDVAYYFETTGQTVYRWLRRGSHRGAETFRDEHRRPRQSKVTEEVELSILKLRTTFKWGTARIQQGIDNLPDFISKSVNCIQGVKRPKSRMNCGRST